jgi:hypothetical protein
MASKVYFSRIDSIKKTGLINEKTLDIFKRLILDEKVKLNEEIPIKAHFGEKGNVTFIKSKNYESLIKYLKSKKIKSFFTDTNVLYEGQRMRAKTHIELAKKHGFTQLPIKIADGERGENFREVKINGKHFKSCKIGGLFNDYNQLIIISHFKGHSLAGFGGAIKNLAMGFASRGGKLAQHANVKPFIDPLKCKACHLCEKNCPVKAIDISKKLFKIDHKVCIGCAACIAICPYHAISVNAFGYANSIFSFGEKMAEYTYAAAKGKKNIYINYAFDITKSCDCHGTKMVPIAKDFGILASTDPVALDKACLDLLEENEGKSPLRGKNIIDDCEKIGLGKKDYEIIEV